MKELGRNKSQIIMAEKTTFTKSTHKDSINRLDASQVMTADTMRIPPLKATVRKTIAQLNVSFSEGLNSSATVLCLLIFLVLMIIILSSWSCAKLESPAICNVCYKKQLNAQKMAVESKQMSTEAIVPASCENAAESLRQSFQRELEQQVRAALDSMKGQMVADMRNAVRSEVDKALQSQQTLLTDQLEAMRSQAATPAPDSQSNIKNIMLLSRSCQSPRSSGFHHKPTSKLCDIHV